MRRDVPFASSSVLPLRDEIAVPFVWTLAHQRTISAHRPGSGSSRDSATRLVPPLPVSAPFTPVYFYLRLFSGYENGAVFCFAVDARWRKGRSERSGYAAAATRALCPDCFSFPLLEVILTDKIWYLFRVTASASSSVVVAVTATTTTTAMATKASNTKTMTTTSSSMMRTNWGMSKATPTLLCELLRPRFAAFYIYIFIRPLLSLSLSHTHFLFRAAYSMCVTSEL